MKAYRFLDEAQAEFLEAIAYFDVQSPGLGDRFIDEVERSVRRVLEFPQCGSPVSDHVRKVVLRNFPYNLLYVIQLDEILLVAVAPQKRRPNYWRKRIRTKRKRAG